MSMRNWLARVGVGVPLLLTACLSDYTPTNRLDLRPKDLVCSHSVGGSHWCTLVYRDSLFQGFGAVLLVLDPQNGNVLAKLVCAAPGKSGALVDMVGHGSDLVAVLDRTSILRIDISNPRAPMVIESMSEKTLGVRPESVSSVDGAIYVSGLGGVVRVDTGERFLAGGAVCGKVVGTAAGPVTTRGGEIVRLSDGSVLGSATTLVALPGRGIADRRFGCVVQGKDAARIGLLDGDLHERASEAFDGQVSHLRYIQGELWAITPKQIGVWRVDADGLSTLPPIRVRGAIDAALVAPNTYLIAGTFGRSLYRREEDARGPADEFFATTREAGRLERVLSDGRRIVAGSPEGNWLYMTGGSCEPSTNPIQTMNPPCATIEGAFGKALIEGADTDAFTIEVAPRVIVEDKGQRQVLQMPQGSLARTVTNVGSDLWIGHDDGIDVWRRMNGSMVRVARVRLQGPVTNIYPRRTDDGASWVSLFGGMGVVVWQPVSTTPATDADDVTGASGRGADGSPTG
ncbi:MAG: hypothetical protein FJ256_06395 [Phycisphaerae bacterium]|nr:hypothetical protein [Phycisphaerae bacterium]